MLTNTQQDEKMDELVSYDLSKAQIAELQETYLAYEVHGEDDTDGQEMCKKGRLFVRDHRIAVEKRAKELKEDANKFRNLVNAKAKELVEPLKAIESHLQDQEDIVRKAEERRRQAEAEERRKRLEYRRQKLQSLGAPYSEDVLEKMTEEAFNDYYDKRLKMFEAEKAEREAEQKRLREAEAQAERDRAEIEKLRTEKRELEEAKAKAEKLAQQQAQRAEPEKIEQRSAPIEVATSGYAQVRPEENAAPPPDDIRSRLIYHVRDNIHTLRDAQIEIIRLGLLLNKHGIDYNER